MSEGKTLIGFFYRMPGCQNYMGRRRAVAPVAPERAAVPAAMSAALARAGSEGTAGSGGSDGSGGGGPQLLPRVVLGPVLWMEVILEQLEDPLGTAVTLSKLLSASRVMLAKYATPKLVGRFAEMIRLLGPQRRLVDFFTAICLVRSQLSDGDRTK